MDNTPTRRPFDVFHPACPSRKVFDHIFSRWGILALAQLAGGPVRFGTLHRSIGGISERMLSQTLKVLEDEGLVARREYDEKPPRVEYSLTDAGQRLSQSLEGVIQALYEGLAERYRSQAEGGPPEPTSVGALQRD